MPAFSRPTWAEIDLDALRHNARTLAAHASGAHLLAVIKANAYGHGAVDVARALEGEPHLAMFGVASVDEGQQLRASGIETPILLLSAILPSEAEAALEARLTPTVYTLEVAHALDAVAARLGRRATVHFKVDTGMRRLGVEWCEATALFGQVRALHHLEIGGVYTHFLGADEADDSTEEQLGRFRQFLSEVDLPAGCITHAANSAATLRYAGAHFDMIRAGIALYGAHPCRDLGPDLGLRPVMTVKSRVNSLKRVATGQGASYGATWRATRPSQLAVLPIGYADGYLRALSNRGQVWLNGRRVPVVGRVTMDQILLDVTGLNVQLGDEAILWGQNLPVEEIAALAGTISYELFCGVAPRVPRVLIHPKHDLILNSY